MNDELSKVLCNQLWIHITVYFSTLLSVYQSYLFVCFFFFGGRVLKQIRNLNLNFCAPQTVDIWEAILIKANKKATVERARLCYTRYAYPKILLLNNLKI